MSRAVVVGAGVGGLAAAVRLLEAGHSVTVFEAGDAPGGKAGRRELGGFAFDTGPSLLTMPWVFRDLLGDACPEMVRVEPVTRYRFADGSSVDLSADLPRALESLESWSRGAGDDWAAFLGVCAQMWKSSEPFLTGEPPWPPRRDVASADPRDFLRVRPWSTLRGLSRSTARDPRLRMIIDRFATYAGAEPRRAPAALAVAGYVEHAFGAWHVPGGIYEIVRALAARVEQLGGAIEYGAPVSAIERRGQRAVGVNGVAADWVVWNGDALALDRLLARTKSKPAERSLSGLVLLLGVRGPTEGIAHHTILFPRDYDAEFDDVFVHRRPARDPTLYVSVSSVTDPSEAPEGGENWFVLANTPSGATGVDWAAEEERVLGLLAARGLDPTGRIVARGSRTPEDLERETGAVGGAIYGDAPHGRLGTLKRPGPRVRGLDNVIRAGGTAHPGGGLPLVALSGGLAARIIGTG